MTVLLPKQQRVRDRKYLDSVRDGVCILTNTPNPDPSHIRYGCLSAGMKPGDDLVLPLNHALHGMSHNIGEVKFWRNHITDEVLMNALKALAREEYAKWKSKTKS